MGTLFELDHDSLRITGVNGIHRVRSILNQTVKFMQTVIILQTSRDSDDKQTDISIYDVPLTMKFTKRRKLEEEAM